MSETVITNNVFKKTVTKKFEWDVIVPDSKRDVLKILSSSSDCFLTDYSFSNGSCNMKLEAVSKILYIPEDASGENICVIDTKENFNMDFDIPSNLSWEYEDIHIKCFSEPCVLINSRKLGVKINVTAVFDLYENVTLDDFFDNPDICCMKKELVSNCIHSVKNEKISISPVFSLPSGKPGISEILMLDVSVGDSDLKPITNKAVFKGNICIDMLYSSDISTIEGVSFETPFTEIIDLNGLNDKMTLMYSAEVKKTDCELIRGEENSSKGFTVNGVIELRMKACTKNQTMYVSDAYSPCYSEVLKKNEINAVLFSDVYSDSFPVKELFEFEDTVINEVYSVKAEAITKNAQLEDGRINMDCVLKCRILYRTQSGVRNEIKSCDFQYSQPVKIDGDYKNIEIMCYPTNLSYVIAGNNMLEIRCNMKLFSYLSDNRNISAVSSVELDKNLKKSLSRAPIVAYFPQKDENVFEVAKKYLSTPDKIKEINSLADDIIKKGDCVIIE